MSLKVAFQMDLISEVNIDADTTFRIAEEAQALGHDLFFYTPDGLSFEEGRILARGTTGVLRRVQGDPILNEAFETRDLRDMDVIWLRQDPPFDMAYITTTHLLDFLRDDVLVVNDPFWVRNYPEKILVLNFPELTPPTAIAHDIEILKAFRARHGDVILKPLYGNGGSGVFLLTERDCNLNSLHELFSATSREPLIMQKFLPEVSAGDKRILLVDGEPVGAINRVPQKGETRSNMHVGGQAEKVKLSARDLEICTKIGTLLREKGQVLAGIDVIGGWLTEINLTSPTGVQELERFDGINVAGRIWDAVLERLKTTKRA